VTPDEDDSHVGWSPDTPGAVEGRIAEIRDTIESLDSTSPADMTEFYYMHGFNELDLAVRDLLQIVESLRRQPPAKPVV
jgi:hypothetical protein